MIESPGASFDALVVGAGPTGLACGIELQQRGVSTVLVEKGCVVNSLYNYPTNMTFFTTPELLEIGNIPMTSLNEKPNRHEALKYYRRVADHYKLNIRQYERVNRIEGEDDDFRVYTTDRLDCNHTYRARKIVLATGYYDVPNMLDVPGEELDKVLHYYKEPHPYYNHDVVVDRRQELRGHCRAGVMLDGRARHIDSPRRGHFTTVSSIGSSRTSKTASRVARSRRYFHSRVVEILKDSIRVATPEGEIILRNDFVFALIGYRPDLEFLAATGITSGAWYSSSPYRSADFGERASRSLPGGSDRRRHAHERDIH